MLKILINTNNGTRLSIYGRQGGWNQTFSFDNNTNRISVGGKCLDIFGGVNSGAQIGLWDCHNGDNQKWVFNGVNLRPMSNQNYCVDASGGLSQGTQLIIWGCHGGGNQRWVAGDNNFGSSYSVNIHAKKTGFISFNGDYGHVLISYKVGSSLVNTQSSWPGYDTDCSTDNGNRNNICDNDAAYVDKIDDWNFARYPSTFSGARIKSVYIDKKLSDLHRYNSGYRSGYMGNFNYAVGSFNTYNGNCASFSLRVWNTIMSYSGYPQLYPTLIDYPSAIYDVI